MLTDRQVTLVEESFRAVAPKADALALRFYERLFEIDPSARALFEGTFMSLQRRKLMAALGAVVSGLRFVTEIQPMLQSLGARHLEFGVSDGQYEAVRAALMVALGDTLGDEFDSDTELAWNEAVAMAASAMKAGAAEAARAGATATVETLGDM